MECLPARLVLVALLHLPNRKYLSIKLAEQSHSSAEGSQKTASQQRCAMLQYFVYLISNDQVEKLTQ